MNTLTGISLREIVRISVKSSAAYPGTYGGRWLRRVWEGEEGTHEFLELSTCLLDDTVLHADRSAHAAQVPYLGVADDEKVDVGSAACNDLTHDSTVGSFWARQSRTCLVVYKFRQPNANGKD
jgi:hypothetical protein